VSLRWLRALLDHGVEVHGQIVVCPGINDGPALEDTLCGILDEYPELSTVAVVPLGVSAHNTEARMRPHTLAEAAKVVDRVEAWQSLYLEALGRRVVYAADEYYLLARRPFPPLAHYGDVAMHEDGIGMARTFEAEFQGERPDPTRPRAGFFAWAEGSGKAANPTGYTAPGARGTCGPVPSGPAPSRGGSTQERLRIGPRRAAPVGILTGEYGALVLEPLVERCGRSDVRVIAVENHFFGGNIGVAGLLVGQDLSRTLAREPAGHRYLLPDVCLSDGRFLDGTTLDDLPHPVEVVATDGIALRAALEI
jgi:NifB/MoaA-like Fe-S oxidoreductase